MKLNLIFNMNDEGDAADFQEFMHLSEYRQLKEELYTYARSLRKYDDRKTIPTEEITEKLYEILSVYTGE